MSAEAVTRLRVLAEHLRTDAAEPVEGRHELAEGLEAYLAGDEARLSRALGLRTRGGLSPARASALARRDELLRRLWKVTPSWQHLGESSAGRLMALSASRYELSRWPRERRNLAAPSAEPAATWWRILRSDVPIPRGPRIAQILREENP